MSTRLDTFHDIIQGRSHTPYLTAAWQHFVGHEYDPADFARTTVDFVKKWDWDWVKINPRAVYYAEAWGAIYDPENYVGVIPTLVTPAISSVADLKTITAQTASDNPAFAEQIESARQIKKELPDRAVLQTLFSPLTVLLHLAGLPTYPGGETHGALTQSDLLDKNPEQTKRALTAIADTLADYVRTLVRPPDKGGAGVDGIFYAVTGTVGVVTPDQFREFSAPYDQIVLDAAQPHSVVFHTCRANSHPEWFADWPISALQWDQALDGNPDVATDLGVTPVGGPQSILFGPGQDLTQLSTELARTLQKRDGKPFLLAPSCTIPTPASNAALEILRKA